MNNMFYFYKTYLKYIKKYRYNNIKFIFDHCVFLFVLLRKA